MKQYASWVLILVLSFVGCESQPGTVVKMKYEHPIAYAPREYICYRAPTPPVIDGLIEAAWKDAPWTEDFVDIEGELKPPPPHRTRAKMLWDDQYFYFAAEIEDPHLWATLTERDAVMYQNDDFEIFIDPDGDGQHYYEFEMNANNAIWDLLMLFPYRVKSPPNYINNWDIKGIRTGVQLYGTINNPSDTDSMWTVEVAMPWSALRELAPQTRMPEDGEQWRVNFSRVDWHLDIVDGLYQKKIDPNTGKAQRWPEENWVWSPSGRVEMHQPETWGYVQFSQNQAGQSPVAFNKNPDEVIKWALWQLYFQQKQHWQEYGHYSADQDHFTIPDTPAGFSPNFAVTPTQFEIIVAGHTGGYWHINERGRIFKTLHRF